MTSADVRPEPALLLLDTTVLVYAVGGEHPYREPCRALIAAVQEGRLRATATPEVVQEFVHVRSRRRDRVDAVELGSAYADLLSPLLVVDTDALLAGLALYGTAQRVGAFDAVLAAVALRNGVAALVSADRGFGTLSGLTHVLPDADGVAALTGSAV